MASNVPPGATLSPDGVYFWDEERQEWIQVYDDGQPDDGSLTSHAPAEPADPAAGHADPNAHTALTETDAHAEGVPASFAVGGLPAFEFEFPLSPAMHAFVDTGTAAIEFELKLTGKVELSFPEHESAATMTPEGLQLAAQEAVAGVTHGMKVTGIGSGHAGLESSFGTQFAQSSITLEPPNSVKFEGHALLNYDYHGSHGTPVHVQGSCGYELKVTVTPHGTEEPAPETTESWFEQHETQLVAVGVVALVVVGAVVVLTATGGAAAPALGTLAVAL